MTINDLSPRLNFILSIEDKKRINISVLRSSIRVTIDVHGLSVHKAKVLISNIIILTPSALYLVINHGYRHGTAIRDALNENKLNARIFWQEISENNPGLTHMRVLAA